MEVLVAAVRAQETLSPDRASSGDAVEIGAGQPGAVMLGAADAKRDRRASRSPYPSFFQTGYYGDEQGRNDSTVLSKLPMFSGFAT
jgi:hypothetical protein